MKLNFQGRAASLRGLNFWQRGSAALPLLIVMILFFVVGATAETTNTWSDAEIQGRQLAQQLCETSPAQNFTNTGVMKVRDGNGKTTEVLIHVETFVTASNWTTSYELFPRNNSTNTITLKKLVVVHTPASANQYRLTFSPGESPDRPGTKDNSGVITMLPFAGDFVCADLGLEFFHWPQQKVLPNPTNLKRGRSFTLLESTHPNPPTNGYSRVRSWIDKESGGILEAEAYDFKGKLLKDFAPKSFKKVNGQWQLQEMDIRNVQTDSRTRLEFDLKP